MMKLSLALLLGSAAAAPLPKSGNMNGKYVVSSGADVGVDWNDDYASKGYEFFDVWAPEIATHYGQVFWTGQGNTPIPDDIVKRFDGKVMAIMGYEQDQVIVTPLGKPGQSPEKDASVPINWAYNHHYMAWMTGKHSEMKEVPVTEDSYAYGAHGQKTEWVGVEKKNSGPRNFGDVAPSEQMFSEGNGGESRKSLHGYPAGFAQLIESPQSWHITPMQIDTRNREHGVSAASTTNCTNMTECAGYEPRQARYGRGWSGLTTKNLHVDGYSGILECPCNSRVGGDSIFYPDAGTKVLGKAFTALPQGACKADQDFPTAELCYTAVAQLGFGFTSLTNATVSAAASAPGCTFVRHADGSATATFNTAKATGTCAASSTKVASSESAWTQVKLQLSLATGHAEGPMKRGPKGQYCRTNQVGVLKDFYAKAPATPATALAACEAFCLTEATCTACSVDNARQGLRWVALLSCGALEGWPGSIVGDVSQKSTIVDGVATITMSGPAGAWFGVGLGAKIMSQAPYTLVVNDTGVMERKIGTCGSEAEHCPGDLLAPSVKLLSNTVADGVRTVVMTRGLTGASKKHFSFDMSKDATIDYISAQGNTQAFAYHKKHASLVLSLSNPTGATCVCNLGVNGELCATNATSCSSFTKNCAARSPTLGAKGEPSGDLLAQHNPTCNSGTYGGGLTCCKHGRIMLDDDQIEQDKGDLLRYHMKFRFWFQEYKPAVPATKTNASHHDLPRIYFQTEANAGEYDIPPAFYTAADKKIVGYPKLGPYPELTPGSTCTGDCPSGPDCECEHTITYNHTVSNMRLIYAGGHCHAPACIGIWLYRNDPGHEMEIVCHQAPLYGKGNVHVDKYDEVGYLALPPCLWGDDKGLNPSVLLPKNTALVSVKKNRNTHVGHFGEMASWQMRGVNF